MKTAKLIVGTIAVGCLAVAASGLLGWCFVRLTDALGLAGFYAFFAVVGLVAGVCWLSISLFERWRRRPNLFLGPTKGSALIGRWLCLLFGHPPIRFGSLYGSCRRCSAIVRAPSDIGGKS